MGAFRLRLYASSRLTAIDVATVTGFTSLTTTLGLAVLVSVLIDEYLVHKEEEQTVATNGDDSPP